MVIRMGKVEDEIANAYFNAVDAKRTIEKNNLQNIKIVPADGNAGLEQTLGDLMNDLILWITELENYQKPNKPTPGKIYALTGGKDKPSIANGNSWSESEVTDG